MMNMVMNYGPVMFEVEFDKETNQRVARILGGPYYEGDLSDAVIWLEDECEIKVLM